MKLFNFGKSAKTQGPPVSNATEHSVDARFLKIREDLATLPQIILGLLPILLIALAWNLVTHVKMKTGLFHR